MVSVLSEYVSRKFWEREFMFYFVQNILQDLINIDQRITPLILVDWWWYLMRESSVLL